MSGPRIHGKSTFYWQAALILLPVAVLAVIGWASLRQDKVLAEHDARERAQSIADELLPALWNELISPGNEASNRIVFQIDDSGQLKFPSPYDAAPLPAPFSLTELSQEQARLWNESQYPTSPATGIEACRHFISSKPPERFAAVAQYQLGVLLDRQPNWAEAEKSFSLVAAAREPNAVGESGLPLQPLAQFKLVQRGRFSMDSFCSNIVCHPTMLTPLLLEQAWALPNQAEAVLKWRDAWRQQERARELFAAAREHLRADSFGPLLSAGANKSKSLISSPQIFWFTLPEGQGKWKFISEGSRVGVVTGRNWIAARAEDTNGTSFVCRPESDIGLWISTNTEHIPAYFAAEVEAGRKKITEGAPPLTYWHNDYVKGGKGGGQFWQKTDSDKISTNLLAFAARSDSGVEQLKVNIYLTGPDELFSTQKSRAMLFGSLVLVSTAAALIGLLAAWRAFHRQLRLTEMKSNFVSSVSHELRAPIASVRLMAESLERGKVHEPEKQNEYFRFIVQECRRLSSLIENVLDFSRIEQGRKQYEFEPTDLLALTRETVKLLEPYAEEKGVRLEFDLKSGIQSATPTPGENGNLELEIDGRAIQQALVNLIDNAIKHSPKGSPVKIGIESEADRTRLWVEDTGPGIPPAEHEKIFERFYRLGSELRRETQGVGIGLSIVRHIVEAHGGQVTVRSNVGQGSRFTIVLPRNRQEKTEETETK
ncbi:MAG TPA: HAMP domain-containing sensor histidine kinase [Verrucomicrobiae bacterium]|jgi:signal transduction histidine kinase|nr:HAMP domain-containing sensor histidine kinase [Verrucomicrobiae bacterium]